MRPSDFHHDGCTSAGSCGRSGSYHRAGPKQLKLIGFWPLFVAWKVWKVNIWYTYIYNIFWDQHWGMSRSSYTQTITQLLCSWSQEQTRKVRREGFAAGGCSQEMTTAAATTATIIITTQKQKKQRCDSKTIAWFSSFPYYMILQVAFGNQIVWSQAGKANLEMNMHGFSQHLIPFIPFIRFSSGFYFQYRRFDISSIRRIQLFGTGCSFHTAIELEVWRWPTNWMSWKACQCPGRAVQFWFREI